MVGVGLLSGECAERLGNAFCAHGASAAEAPSVSSVAEPV